MNKVKFVDLPATSRGRYGALRQALLDNAGAWTEYPGSPKQVYTIAAQYSRNGQTFEGRVRNGKGYIRAVAS